MSRYALPGKIIAIILILTAVLTFAACSGQSSSGTPSASPSSQTETPAPSISAASDSFKYDENAVIKNAKAVVDLVNKGDYTTIYKQLRDDVQKQSTADAVKAAFEQALAPAGKFTSYQDAKTMLTSDTTYGTYIVAGVVAQYEKAVFVYTISFDKDMKLIGLYIKPAE